MRNTLESRVAVQLEKAGLDYQYEVTKLDYILKKRYIPDFTVTTNNGDLIYIEVKGYLRPEDRTKMLAVKKANPNKTIVFIFQNANNRLNKNSKTTYGEWATKNNFLWTDMCSDVQNFLNNIIRK